MKTWWKRNRWLALRRLSQAGFLALFLSGPVAGLWIAEGTLASSLTLGVLPLTDPLVALQALVAGHALATTAILGAAIVLAAYGVLGGRLYCAWVCPINPVTDAARYLRDRLRIGKGWQPPRSLRLWMLAMVLAVSALTGTIAWELVNPITVLHRGLVYGGLFTGGFALALLVSVFLFDLLVARRGWCGHLCPVGAFYGLVGSKGLVRVSATGRERCDDCLDCYAVCPEPHILAPVLKARGGAGPLIASADCTTCGRCADVCHVDVFRFTHRLDAR